MSLYWQDITRRGEQKDYQKLRDLLGHRLERKLWDGKKKLGAAKVVRAQLPSVVPRATESVAKALRKGTAGSGKRKANAPEERIVPGLNPIPQPRQVPEAEALIRKVVEKEKVTEQ